MIERDSLAGEFPWISAEQRRDQGSYAYSCRRQRNCCQRYPGIGDGLRGSSCIWSQTKHPSHPESSATCASSARRRESQYWPEVGKSIAKRIAFPGACVPIIQNIAARAHPLDLTIYFVPVELPGEIQHPIGMRATIADLQIDVRLPSSDENAVSFS